jgi:2-polyprenyl-6-methoxyphenol hydroxylase-like FAD-dependent oxidoreductase
MSRIAIIGGGIGGLATAISLRRYGFEPEVFEQAPKLLDVGAAIALWSNAMRVLDHLSLRDKVLESAGEIKEIRWLTQDGTTLNSVRFSAQAMPSVALHRADLQHILLNALPPSSIHLDHRFLEQNDGGGKIHVSFNNGKSVDCEFLIGADGIHSCVRNRIAINGPPVFRGYTVWRGIAPTVPNEIPAHTALEIHGRGKRFGIGPVGHGRIGWWAAANAEDPGFSADEMFNHRESSESGTTADTRLELLELFEGWYPPVIELIRSTSSSAILRTQASDRASTTSWGLRRITLLGDAIHPTTPNLGQGGCMAIEDALVLARCFQKYGPGEHALRAYEHARFSRTATITKYSRVYGDVGQWENRWSTCFRNKLISIVPEIVTRQLIKNIFHYDATQVRV